MEVSPYIKSLSTLSPFEVNESIMPVKIPVSNKFAHPAGSNTSKGQGNCLKCTEAALTSLARARNGM